MKLFFITVLFFIISPITQAMEEGKEGFKPLFFHASTEPFGAIQFLTSSPPLKHDNGNPYPQIWAEVSAYALSREELYSLPLTPSLVDEYVIAALCYKLHAEFNLNNTHQGRENLHNLLLAIPESVRGELAIRHGIPSTILTLANRATARLSTTKKHYATQESQQAVRKLIDSISSRAKNLLLGLGSYKIGTVSTVEQRAVLIQAQMLETLRQFSQLFPKTMTPRFISKKALKIVGYNSQQSFNESDPLQRQQIAAALISALTIVETTTWKDFHCFSGKFEQLMAHTPRLNIPLVIENFKRLVPKAENYLNRIAPELHNQVKGIFLRKPRNFTHFLHRHYAYESAKFLDPLVTISEKDYAAGAQHYLTRVVAHDFPDLVVRHPKTKALSLKETPCSAYIENAFQFFVEVKALSECKANKLISDLDPNLSLSDEENSSDEEDEQKEETARPVVLDSLDTQLKGFKSQLDKLIAFTNTFAAPRPEPIFYINKEGVRAVREGDSLKFSDRRGKIVILINSFAYQRDKRTFKCHVFLSCSQGLSYILQPGDSHKEAEFLIHEDEIDEEFAERVQQKIPRGFNIPKRILPRSDNPYLFSRFGSLAPVMSTTGKSRTVTLTAAKEKKEDSYVMIEGNKLSLPSDRSQEAIPLRMRVPLHLASLSGQVSLPTLPPLASLSKLTSGLLSPLYRDQPK